MIQWYYLAVIAAIFTAVSTLTEKYALNKEHATQYSASVSVISFLFSLAFIPFISLANLNPYAIAVIYVLSLFAAWNFLVSARLYRHSSISMSTPTVNTLPNVFIAVIAFFFLDEKLKPFQYASIAILIIATYLMFITGKKSIWGKVKGSYIRLLINSALTAAISWVIIKYVLNLGVNPILLLLLSQGFIALNMVIFMQFKFGGLSEIGKMVKQYPLALLSSGVSMVLYRILLFWALVTAQVSIAFPLRGAIFIILTVLFGSIFFKEDNLVKRVLLAMVMIAASYILVL
ncbi:MAG TPA: EamA family transporter [Candidatus Acidoferrales bacterium]|nr:EamA family transporter [Candidatus Acidoferrales bacterium]